MIRATSTLLFCALFLRGPEEAAAAPRGRCVGGLCSFQDLRDFHGADELCRERNGRLFEPRTDGDAEALRGLLSDVGERYWLRGGGRADPRLCPAVSVTRGRNVTVGSQPCRDALDGFVCQFGSDDMCGPLQGVRGGARVAYVFADNFQVVGSQTFPPGTIATAGEGGAEYPDSTHLCTGEWLRAPWNCEVMNGGCEHECDRSTGACACPERSPVHPNNVSCVSDPCARCEHGCQRRGAGHACTCNGGYRLAQDGAGCVDVDECEEDPDLCINDGEECVNLRGTHECRCTDGFVEEDGRCVNVSICVHCEHMKCPKVGGVYGCACRDGFKVSPADPTKCVPHCGARDCPAQCNPDPNREKKDMQQCFCPEGYIKDIRNRTAICTDIDECEQQRMCDHECVNLFGGYRCLCRAGYRLRGVDRCVKANADDDADDESGSGGSTTITAPPPPPPSSRPAVLFPGYVRTGSALGITAFATVCAALLACLVRWMLKRCSNFKLHTFKHRDIDIFTLQQVTSETYKRLSFDKPFKSDPQRLSTPVET